MLTQLRDWPSGIDLTNFRTGVPVRLSVGLDDVYAVGDPITVTVTPNVAAAEIGYELDQVRAQERTRPTHDADHLPISAAADGTTGLEIPTPGPGVYRLTFNGSAKVEPVNELLVVAPR